MNIDDLKKMSHEELINEILRVEKEKNKLEKQAITDGLTGLHNRASFDDHMQVQIDLAERSGKPLSLIVVDLDKFKSINDTHGHSVGDMVLKNTSKILDSKSRKSDIACRFGGEEMVLILPETTRAGAALVAEKLRIELAKVNYKATDGSQFKATGSFGVASYDSQAKDTAQALFDKADKAVYKAKELGRNQVQVTENAKPSKKSKIQIKTDVFSDTETKDFLHTLENSNKTKHRSKKAVRPS